MAFNIVRSGYAVVIRMFRILLALVPIAFCGWVVELAWQYMNARYHTCWQPGAMFSCAAHVPNYWGYALPLMLSTTALGAAIIAPATDHLLRLAGFSRRTSTRWGERVYRTIYNPLAAVLAGLIICTLLLEIGLYT